MKKAHKPHQHSIQVYADQESNTCDQLGNLKQGLGQYYEYNEFNQLARVRDNGPTGPILEEYIYDHEGNRLKKYEPQLNQTTYYFNDNYIRVVNTTGTYQYVYYYEGDTLIGREDPDGRKFFYHPDVLGSTDLITNESGGTVEETTYEPYGEVIDGGQTSEFLYTSKELDDQTGLYYFGARYYDPFFMHFTQPDDTITDVYNPQDLNRYAYVRNNPYKYVDPDGEETTLATVLIVTYAASFILGLYDIAYHAYSDLTKEAIKNAQLVSTKNRDTALGRFNEQLANQLETQNRPGAKLSLAALRAEFSSRSTILSGSDIGYIEKSINPALSKLDIRDSSSLRGSQILNLLKENNKQFAQDKQFRNIEEKFRRYEGAQQKISSDETKYKNNQQNRDKGNIVNNRQRTSNARQDSFPRFGSRRRH